MRSSKSNRSAHKLTLCDSSESFENKLHCEEGTALANKLLGHLQLVFENAEACGQVTGVRLGCRKGGWQSGKLGPGNKSRCPESGKRQDALESVQLSYHQPDKTTSADSVAERIGSLEDAISGIFGLLLSQCQQKHELAGSEELYKVILHAMSDVAILTDKTGRITYVCPNADGFCGRGIDEVREFRSILEILDPDSECFNMVRTGLDVKDMSVRLIAKDGRPVTMLVDVINTRLARGPFLFTFRNVTELARAREELAEANQQLQHNASELSKKNIALKELLHQIGQEFDNIRDRVRSKMETTALPLIAALEKGADSSLKPIVAGLKEALIGMVDGESRGRNLRVSNLTSRELQICNMIASGCTSKEIACALNVASATIVNTRKRIRKKLGISGQAGSLAAVWRTLDN